ncbi:MAG: FtsX-like permease family protein [Promethearchaeota archaeon]
MSFDFAIKEIFRKWEHWKSYLSSIMLASMLCTLIIYIINGFGVEIFASNFQIFNFTTNDLFLKYFRLILIFMQIILVSWVFLINHNIISYKAKDLARMKAIGSLPNRLSGILISELYIIDILGILLGFAIGFFVYLILFFIFGTINPTIKFYFDLIYIPIAILSVFIVVYIANGYEIRKLSKKRFGDIHTDEIKKQYFAAHDLRLIPKIISKFGLLWKIAIINLKRKKTQLYRTLIFLVVVFTLLTVLTSAGMLISSTIKTQIHGAQGENIVIFGHKDVVSLYQQRYAEFSNSSLSFTNQEIDLLNKTYLFNDSIINDLENSENFTDNFDNKDYGIQFWEKRLFFYDKCYEIKGYRIIGDYNEYQVIGDSRVGFIPVVGVEYKEYIDDWVVFGTINKTENPEPCAIVGDTLAISFFEAATYQKIQFQGGTSRHYRVTGIFYDSFCSGNATYVPLDSIRYDLNINDQVNIGMVKLQINNNNKDDIIQIRNNFISMLNVYLHQNLGEDFEAIDLTPTFNTNIKSISRYENLIWLTVFISTSIALWGIVKFNKANLYEKIKDFVVIRAIGGSKNHIQDIIFYENFLTVLLAMIISLGLSLNISITLIFSEAIKPPLLTLMGLWALLLIIIVFIMKIISKIFYNKVIFKEISLLRTF